MRSDFETMVLYIRTD